MINQQLKPAAMARDVLDALRQVHATEERLTGILATLLAMDDSVVPAEPMTIPADMLISGSVVGTKITGDSALDGTITAPVSVKVVNNSPDATVAATHNVDGSVDVVVNKEEAGTIVSAMDVLKDAVKSEGYGPGWSKFRGKAKTAIIAESATRHDRILDLWCNTTLSQSKIAEVVGINDRNVRKEITKAKKQGDPRAIERHERPKNASPACLTLQDCRTQGTDAPDPEAGGVAARPDDMRGKSGAGSTEETQVRNEPESVGVVSAETAGGEEGDSSSSAVDRPEIDEDAVKRIGEALKPAEDPAADDAFVQAVVETIAPTAPAPVKSEFEGNPDDVILFDRVALQIAGPIGVLTVPRPMFNVFRHLADGRMYDIKTLAAKGGYPAIPAFYESLRSWKRKLATIGVDLVFVAKELVRIRAIED